MRKSKRRRICREKRIRRKEERNKAICELEANVEAFITALMDSLTVGPEATEKLFYEAIAELKRRCDADE